MQQNLEEKQTNKQICPIQVDMFKYDRSFCLELVHLLLITFSSPLLIKQCKIRKNNNIYLVSELKMLVHHGPVISKRNTTLSTKHAKLDIHMEMAAGEPAYYPGNDNKYQICSQFHQVMTHSNYFLLLLFQALQQCP